MAEPNPSAGEGSAMYKKLRSLWTDQRRYTQRLLPAAMAMLAACFTFLFFGPFEMVALSGTSLSYTYGDIFWILVIPAVVVFLAGTALIACLKGKVYYYTVTLVFALTVCGYLQAALMNGTLGQLTGDAVDWHTKTADMLANLLVWIVLFLAAFFLLFLHRKLWKQAVIYGSLLLTLMQLASAVTIPLTYPIETDDSICLTDKGMYEYAAEENIFVFVLDRLDYDYIDRILAEDPAFLDPLDGFTGYTNAISAYDRTAPALNQLLTGSESAFQIPASEFYAKSWLEDGKNLLKDLHKQNYTAEFYSFYDKLFSDPDYARQYVSNLNTSPAPNARAVLPKLLKLSAYRYLPIAMKPFFWADTNYYNENVFDAAEETVYEFNDSGYGPGFLESTADRAGNSFKLYHFFGPHAPYTMNADGTASKEQTSAAEQLMGCFRILYAAFDRMKELGIYDRATILITADHGSAIDDTKPLQKATRIGLFYKPAGSRGTPFVQSAAQVCTDNIPATIMKAAGVSDYARYGTALDEVREDAAVERFYYKSAIEDGTTNVYKYAVTGDAALFENWELVGKQNVPAANRFH